MKTYSSLTEAEREAICTAYDGIKYMASDPLHAAACVAARIFSPTTQAGRENAFAIALTVLVFRKRIEVTT